MQVGTYNVNGHKPPMGLQLAPWLSGAADADIVIVAFQEIVPLNANNVFNGEPGTYEGHVCLFQQCVQPFVYGNVKPVCSVMRTLVCQCGRPAGNRCQQPISLDAERL